MDEWEHLRARMPEHDERMSPCIRLLSHWVDIAVQSFSPSVIITWNKLDHLTGMFWKAADYYGIKRYMIERSPFNDMWVESEGILSESNIFEDYSQRKCIPEKEKEYRIRGDKIIDDIRRNPYGLRKGEGANQRKQQNVQNRHPVFLFLMDNILWCGWDQMKQPQRKIDFPLYDTPDEALDELTAIIADQLNGTLVVKKHPACHSLTPDRIPDRAVYFDGDLAEMIEEADVIILFNSKTAYAALAQHKAVVTLAPNPVDASGATYHASCREQVRETLEQAVRRSHFDEKNGGLCAICRVVVNAAVLFVSLNAPRFSGSLSEYRYDSFR